MSYKVRITLLALALALSALVYLPGISGPYVFDDRVNILKNSYLKTNSLHPKELYHASFSVGSGPLLRPISMLSFALNHYFSGSFDETTPLKLTNLCIHIINGLLVFFLMRLMFARVSQMGPRGGPDFNQTLGIRNDDLLAAAVTLFWIVHPINLTSVLYVVQRMASLSALFTLLGLICYLRGRSRMVAGRSGGGWLIGIGLVVCGGLGVLSKENAALLPFFMLALEFVLFGHEKPWHGWRRLSTRTKSLILIVLFAGITAAVVFVIDFALPRYAGRDFSMPERLLTESRVMFFYLSLILLPRINQFGLHHDDIALSQTLVTPWTTFSSILGIIALLGLVCYTKKRLPLLSLGILWFFVGHLMESTLLPLEIAHEHRNYVASVGVLFAIVHVMHRVCLKLGHNKVWLLYPVIALVLAGTTALRASQWADYNGLTRYQALHHPNSARAQGMLSSLLYVQGDYTQAMEAVRRAAKLAPNEAGYKINMQVLADRLGRPLDPARHEEILALLATGRISAFTQISLEHIGSCVATDCPGLQAPMEAWLNTIIDNLRPSVDSSYFYYLLGRTLVAQGKILDGLNTLERAHQADPKYLHPLFEIASVFLQLRQTKNAELMLERLRRANENNLHPRDKEIAELAAAIESLKDETKNASKGDS